MSTKSPECYATDPQARCLRVEASPRKIFILPLDQLAFAELDSDGKEQLLHLSFATHEVMVHGTALRRIETALHKLELSFLAVLPAKYLPLVADGQPKIRDIVVTEIRPGAEPGQQN
ncbi:MAG: hypothetical protein WCK57_01810 [Verrucomicrobiae bacterium]